MLSVSQLKTRLSAREDSEHEQALLRVVIVGLVLAYMAMFHESAANRTSGSVDIVLILAGFLAVSVGIFAAICAFPKPSVPRRLLGMVADVAGCTWYMWVAGEYGFFVIGIFLFITFGNGFRFGSKFLFGCQALSIIGLTSVLLFVPFWIERRIAGIGLLIALIVLPLYVSTLLKRIQEARARAEEANLAKTTFLANMSHEIRTPLNGIVGVVDLFKTTELSNQQTELVRLLRHSVFVLRSLVDDVLDISKIESGRLNIEVASFDLHATINGLVQLLRPHAQSKGLALHASVDPELDYHLRGDFNHLRQILLNLLGNAIKFTERGDVTLTVMLKKATDDGVTARFEVKDTGIGISEAMQSRIFERFVQADQSATRRFGGSGLGTTIAKQLVELMGGSIGVESRIAEGTTFWFELPLLRDVSAAAAEPAALDPSESNERTLLICDQTVALTVSPMLAAAGESVELVSPNDAVGIRLDALMESGVSIRAVVASCRVDAACAAFSTVLQRFDDKPVALVYIAREPLSVVDNARIRSIREVTVLEPRTTPRIISNAIHAAIANGGREVADVIDLTQLIKRERPRLRILVADDNSTNQTILSQLLTSAGHTVMVAGDGEEALDIYEREQPDAALLDFNMPGRNGLEVVQAIRMLEPAGVRMPTIILSASVTLETRKRAQDAGADEFIGKPYDAAALLEKVDKLAQRLGQRSSKVPDTAGAGRQVVTNFPGRRREDARKSGDELLDYERLAELEDISRDSKFMADLLQGFRSDVESLMCRFEAAVAQGDARSIGDILHALKGAAVGLGASKLSRHCDVFALPELRAQGTLDRTVADMRSCVDATFAQLDLYARKQLKALR